MVARHLHTGGDRIVDDPDYLCPATLTSDELKRLELSTRTVRIRDGEGISGDDKLSAVCEAIDRLEQEWNPLIETHSGEGDLDGRRPLRASRRSAMAWRIEPPGRGRRPAGAARARRRLAGASLILY